MEMQPEVGGWGDMGWDEPHLTFFSPLDNGSERWPGLALSPSTEQRLRHQQADGE